MPRQPKNCPAVDLPQFDSDRHGHGKSIKSKPESKRDYVYKVDSDDTTPAL